MRVLINIFVLCLIFTHAVQLTSAVDLLNILRRAVGIKNHTDAFSQKDFHHSNERYLRSMNDDTCRCCS
jgi:ribosomal protein S15P/S13E